MIPYSLHLALLLAACWSFYKLLLQNETYYKLNRGILLSCLALAFVLPFIPVAERFSLRATPTIEAYVPKVAPKPDVKTSAKAPVQTTETVYYVPTKPDQAKLSGATPVATKADALNREQIIKWVVWIYWFGVAAFGLNFLIQLIALLYQAYKRPFIQDGIYRIVELDGDKAPCSFGNTIFINPAKYDWDTYNQILMHEKVHIKQGHSVDLILAELMLVVQWFNPFAWLYRKEIESNLEFLTDDSVIHNHQVEPEAYQMSLVKVAVPNLSMRITTNYNQSLLKRRIMMMNSKRSNVHNIWKYLMLVPFLVLLLCIFNKPIQAALAKPQQPTAKNKFSFEVNGKTYTATKDTTIKLKGKNYSVKFGKPSTETEEQKTANEAPTPQVLAAMNSEGITAVYIKSFKDIGYSYTSLETMRSFYAADISAVYVKSFMDIGYKYLSPETMLSFNSVDISAVYVKSFIDIGYQYISPETMISFNTVDISASFVRSFKDIGYQYISPETMISFNTVDISASFVRSFKDINYAYLSPETMISFNTADISASFIRSFKDINYAYLSPETMISFNTADISASFVRSFKDINYPYLSPETMISFNTADITASFVKSFIDIGYKYTSPETMISFNVADVTASYIKSFMDIKYPYLSPDAVLSLQSSDVTASYVKSVQGTGKDVTPDDLTGKQTKPKTNGKKKPQ
ncbi:M56 family metallopeptidase [Mucilaginibacter myungsuensis]|uniref:M56 family metallopeptidase n=1 Tax=Mucilaginibacter myungsuensis TaxID=649104 RepID=A0A929KXA6_9SPHI|nr:M56 family metallopeptidase [Mucilaginibacter myungsuensis]MBE9661643.1 M56 family metallopeptidase [Mucilaginibacter myungsuensis]MDN3597787.1 M56 family metallopeptidase [Mucilaginibacter myungsuensis]